MLRIHSCLRVLERCSGDLTSVFRPVSFFRGWASYQSPEERKQLNAGFDLPQTFADIWESRVNTNRILQVVTLSLQLPHFFDQLKQGSLFTGALLRGSDDQDLHILKDRLQLLHWHTCNELLISNTKLGVRVAHVSLPFFVFVLSTIALFFE